jgi:NAD(P)-dependent dehydrogenase (short-subunit alcohol dehydrogenase family)
MMKIDLSGKVVLLTGASRGIGLAIARELIASGATVALHYHQNRKNLEKLAGKNKSRLFQANLGNHEDTVRLYSEVSDFYSGIHLLINNAGIAVNSPVDQPVDRWAEDWQTTMDINLKSSAVLCKCAISYWLENRQTGKIINVASRAAFRGDTPEYMAYAASKGGMVALTRSIARGYGKSGITAYTVAPGFINTDMAKDFFQRYGKKSCLGDLALSEIPQPEDVARPVIFLCSDYVHQASGCTLDINSATYFH